MVQTYHGSRLQGAGQVGLFIPMAALGVGFVALGLLLTADNWMLGLFISIVGAAICCMAWPVGRVGWHKLRVRAVVDEGGFDLRLPASRSLGHRLKPFVGRLSFDEIGAIQARLEARRLLGLTDIRRVYAVRRRNGEVLVLEEDRGLAMGFAREVGQLSRFMAETSGHGIEPIGMVLTRNAPPWLGGSSPPWDTPSLDEAVQQRIWESAARTARLAGYAAVGASVRG